MSRNPSRPRVGITVSIFASMFLVLGQGEIRAGIVSLDFVQAQTYRQTENNIATPVGASLSARMVFEDSDGFTSATLTPPGSNTPLAMQLYNRPGSYSVARIDRYFASLAEMRDAFPLGNYTFMASSSAGSESSTLENLTEHFLGAPTLSGTTFLDLASLDPTLEFTLRWNAFDQVQPGWSSNYFYLIDLTDHSYPLSGSLDSDLTSYIIPANTFMTGHSYRLELTSQNILRDQSARLSYLQQTSIEFTVNPMAVPEPSSLLMLSLGALGLLGHGWHRRRKEATTSRP